MDRFAQVLAVLLTLSAALSAPLTVTPKTEALPTTTDPGYLDPINVTSFRPSEIALDAEKTISDYEYASSGATENDKYSTAVLPGDHLEASGDMSAVGAEESQLELTASGDVDVELSTESSGLTTNVVKRGVDGGEYLVELAKDLEQICKVELMAYNDLYAIPTIPPEEECNFLYYHYKRSPMEKTVNVTLNTSNLTEAAKDDAIHEMMHVLAELNATFYELNRAAVAHLQQVDCDPNPAIPHNPCNFTCETSRHNDQQYHCTVEWLLKIRMEGLLLHLEDFFGPVEGEVHPIWNDIDEDRISTVDLRHLSMVTNCLSAADTETIRESLEIFL